MYSEIVVQQTLSDNNTSLKSIFVLGRESGRETFIGMKKGMLFRIRKDEILNGIDMLILKSSQERERE